ncbi:hypothetical protein [Verrucosispora sioxanthis]|uniref:Uncharacterized protein n=1 Tax=Verrucosispora sioxanthis TaxID=2499994 RepID=A0A6M1L3V5_9ACTN|nr:hypothetical protein [Verrucosispora sioxanthis]NEE64497.1 hypothetical protein [Verrucosispora sioxanthis]NGM13607.1 hypothetical protein [Verrucosispora sioxanthis]
MDACRGGHFTDTRAAAPGWNVSAQVSDFTSDNGSVSGAFLGWEPNVWSRPRRRR